MPDWVFEEFYEKTLEHESQPDTEYLILEVGIGTGRTVGPLMKLGIHLVGIDVSGRMLKKLKEKLRKETVKAQVSLILCDVTRLPFQKCSFNRVYAVNVLPFVRKCNQAIQEIKSALKPKCLFVVGTRTQPELQTKFGKVYSRIFMGTVHRRNVPETILRRIIGSLRLTCIKPLRVRMENMPTSGSWNFFLKRQSKTRQFYTVCWKERILVSTIVDRLEKRFVSIRTYISAKEYDQLTTKLNKWKRENIRKIMQTPREFTYIEVQF